MAGERITVRERLAPDITASLLANYRSAADAILELIDNSVDSRLASRPVSVDLLIRPAFVQITTTGETAAREVFASLQGVSVSDYECRVNEVLMVALDLRRRRRRAPRVRQPRLDLR